MNEYRASILARYRPRSPSNQVVSDFMYPAIEDHGIIGNLRTAALVSLDGTIDFFCPARFDNPTLFASLLDAAHGGFCSIRPISTSYRRKQLYLPDTNVLLTRFLSPAGVAEVIDFMPLGGDAECSTIIRQVNITRGEMELRFECSPAFHYASDSFEVDSEKGLLFRSKDSGTTVG
jgi:GH15 family glucan-1,4-alpha-glucosidase